MAGTGFTSGSLRRNSSHRRPGRSARIRQDSALVAWANDGAACSKAVWDSPAGMDTRRRSRINRTRHARRNGIS